MGKPCIGPQVPAEWQARAQTTLSPEGVRFGLASAASDGTVFGQYGSSQGSGIGSIGRDGALTKLSQYETNVSGLNTLGADAAWVVWSQGDSATNMSDWSVRAFNQRTAATITLATSHLPDGTLLFGQQPLPVVRGVLAAWAQPQPLRGSVNESEVRVVDLTSGQVTVLTSGRVSSPVFAGPLLVWARRDQDGSRYSLEAVDPDTLKPVALPAPLSDPGSIVYLAGSSQHLAWSAEGLQQLTVWTFGSGQLRRYSAPDIKHYFQFLQLAGPYVLWYGGITSTVLDLDSNAGFDVGGTVAGSDQWLALEEPASPVAKGEFASSRIARLSTATAPPIRCGA